MEQILKFNLPMFSLKCRDIQYVIGLKIVIIFPQKPGIITIQYDFKL